MHKLGENIFGDENTEHYKAIMAEIDKAPHFSHSMVMEGKNNCLVYTFYSKSDFSELKEKMGAQRARPQFIAKMIFTTLRRMVELLLRNTTCYSAIVGIIERIVNHEFFNFTFDKLKQKGLLKVVDDDLTINIGIDDLDDNLLADIRLFKKIMEAKKKELKDGNQ